MTNRDFPRLLVATEFPPNASGGGPAVLRQMLKDWPVENLYWWSVLPDRSTRFNQKTAAHLVANIPRGLYPNRRYTYFKSGLLERLWTPWAAHHFRKALDEIQPNVIWVIPHIWAIPPLARVLVNSKTKFHTTMQDYVDANHNVARFGRKRSRRLARLADQLYAKARTRDATSHPMIADLELRTGKGAAQMLHAGLDESDFEFLAAKVPVHHNQIRIAHAGTIIEERDFELFVSALARARSQIARPITVEFFGAHSYQSRRWFDRAWMREQGDLPEPELAQRLRECTWGLASMALSDDDPRYNRFSFPTKFITYLAAGLPMIMLGHPSSSLLVMGQQYRVGLCLTAARPTDLEHALVRGLSVEDPWLPFSSEIQRCARAKFDLLRAKETLFESFERCRRLTEGGPQKSKFADSQ